MNKQNKRNKQNKQNMITGDMFKQACKRADTMRLITGLGQGSNILGQCKQGFNHPIIAGHVQHDPKGSNKVLDIITIIDNLRVDRDDFIAGMFEDPSLITSKLSLLVMSSEITNIVANTRKNPPAFVKMIKAIQDYLVSQNGKLDDPKAGKVIDNTPIKYS